LPMTLTSRGCRASTRHTPTTIVRSTVHSSAALPRTSRRAVRVGAFWRETLPAYSIRGRLLVYLMAPVGRASRPGRAGQSGASQAVWAGFEDALIGVAGVGGRRAGGRW